MLTVCLLSLRRPHFRPLSACDPQVDLYSLREVHDGYAREHSSRTALSSSAGRSTLSRTRVASPCLNPRHTDPRHTVPHCTGVLALRLYGATHAYCC